MHALKIFLRILKFLAKAVLGLLVIILVAIAIIHIPMVQKSIALKLSSFLSSKLESRVTIESVKFSLLGDVRIENMTLWDPQQNQILSAQTIEATSDIFDLVNGDLIFDEIHLAGIDGKLIQTDEGLNIQFIIDAFKPKNKSEVPKAGKVSLSFRKIWLEDIVFEFTSMVSGTTVSAKLGTFTSSQAEFSTNPTTIKADQIILEQSVVHTLSTRSPEISNDTATAAGKNALSPDFGTGIIVEIRDLQFKNNEVSFHRHEVTDTRKFDPAHVSVKDLQLSVSDILMTADTLTGALEVLSLQLPGFTLTNLKSGLQMNRKEVTLSGFHLISGANELQANLTVPYYLKSADDTTHAHFNIALNGQVNPTDMAYFFSDSLMNQFTAWGPTALEIESRYSMGAGNVKTLSVNTEKSYVHAEGLFQDALHIREITWRDFVIDASIGSDFKKTLTPFLKDITIPPGVTLQLKSSGNAQGIFADAKVFTAWGNVKSVGSLTRRRDNVDIDVNVTGEKLNLQKWLSQPSLGPVDLSVRAKGIIGEDQQLDVSGLISKAVLLNDSINNITFNSTTGKNKSSVLISIADSNFRSEITSEIAFGGPLRLSNNIVFNDFKLGRLLDTDSTFRISGAIKSKLTTDPKFLEAFVEGGDVSFHSKTMKYLLDTLFVHGLISETKSELEYYTEHAKAKAVANFDLTEAPKLIKSWSETIVEGHNNMIDSLENRTARLTMELDDPSFLKLLGVNINEFSSFTIKGEFDAQKESATLLGSSGKFKGYGLSLDTVSMSFKVLHSDINASMKVNNLFYDSIQLGNLDLDVLTNIDTTITALSLTNDSSTVFEIRTRILSSDSGRLVYPDKLMAFNNDYTIDPANPIHIKNRTISFNQFSISRDNMQVDLDGDMSRFDASVKNMDLTPLNFLLSRDTTIINKGFLNCNLSYTRNEQLDLMAKIDSLSLYNSSPLSVAATAVTNGNEVPFDFLLTNETNNIDLKGRYFQDNARVDASLVLDINNPEIFQFLVAGIFEELKGSVKGKTTITGPLKKPAFKGSLRFLDVALTTANPRISVNVQDDSIMLTNSGLRFNKFTLYDMQHHPLTITGDVNLQDYESLVYDLQVNSKGFSLINNPDSTSGRLRGLLLIDSDIKLKGSQTDTNIEAKLTIKDSTNLTFVTAGGDIELIKAEGIVDFIDPLLPDSMASESDNYYDSLIASLPEFNLNSTLTIEDKAAFRIIIDEQSGDYIQASGRADLELALDRTGNLSLAGNYTINKGVYRLSFYDLVKKNFELVQGSSINWSGSPENGDLNIKARHTVESNSIGLIGHEIGENEKSIYKRSLDYEVGIIIGGTVEKPIISFTLNLPEDDKVSYPVLANKLDRLQQPEYQSELNKQVFGLLVLGGFLPETNNANVNSNLVATTALSNSVNALLASQLNRFASQYVKGVSIDVGIQSYSDYSAPGGKTQTAMDFRVSKSLMNDRLSFEIGGDFDINQDQSGSKTGKNYRGDIAIIYDLTGNGDKKLKLFNNETYDIVYQEIRNTGISIIFIREFDRKEKYKIPTETANKDR